MSADDEVACTAHPCAPHGFARNASHSEDRYVCDCESWRPDRTCAGLALLARAETAEAALRVAVIALANAAESNPVYQAAYQHVSDALTPPTNADLLRREGRDGR